MTGYLSCATGDVHVWRVTLDCAPSDFLAHEAALSEDERVRASLLKTEQLSSALDHRARSPAHDPSGICRVRARIAYHDADVNGKPKLAKIHPAPSFNLSHTAKSRLCGRRRRRRWY